MNDFRMNALKRFQFHNGSIKRDLTGCVQCRYGLCFNSTMVRLKGIIKRCRAEAKELFQFHNGSIKSAFYHNGHGNYSAFQFHNGSIKSQRNQFRADMGSLVSIPQWFD